MSEDLAPTLKCNEAQLSPALGGGRAKGQMVDERALLILVKTYWTSAGWREHPETAPEDLAYAISAGTMFPPRTFIYDDMVGQLAQVCRRLTPQEVGAAFVASLGSRRLDLRSPLGSYSIWRHYPVNIQDVGDKGRFMDCDNTHNLLELPVDLNVLNFERHKWGGVRHNQFEYAWLDLSQFELLSRPSPTPDDHETLRAILRAACEVPIGSRPGVLEKALAKVVKSNQAERQVLIRLLAYAGVLDCEGYPSFLHRFVQPGERVHPGNEWGYPAGWWRGKGTVNEEAVALYFGASALNY